MLIFVMRHLAIIFSVTIFLAICVSARAETISLTQRQVVEIAAQLITNNELSDAKILLLKQPFDVLELEIERLYLLGRIALAEKRYSDAINIYRHVLDYQPGLSKIRIELALAYMATEQWYRADYHMRLAASDSDIPPEVMMSIRRYLFIIRQNKNWNLWANFGMAPENNINSAAGGEECITYSNTFGTFPYPLCRRLPEPEKAFGFNAGFGGNYEFKLGNQWRLKNDFGLHGNFYDKNKYDMYYLSASTGPRYVFQRGDVWLAATGYKMYYGQESYRYSIGAKLETNYDFTRRISSNLLLQYKPTYYYGSWADYLDGDVYSAGLRLIYNFNSSMYVMLRPGIERENAAQAAYANWRKSVAVGFGAEVPYGFRVYIEPSFARTDYDGARWTVADIGNGSQYTQITESFFTQIYSVSLSNNRVTLYGFTPVINYSYTDRESNIGTRSYSKHSIGFMMQQRF
ncbi:MAG: surface lipoprotein assembly modifier [Alphaproteobacteria bacterium]|nr:surface lipoprotein assembly modifier [Alphaproteobacteria bacterium]